MKSSLVFAALVLCTGPACALEGQFDRSAEVSRYVEAFNTKTRGGVIEACRLIHISGLGDDKLAAAINDRLLRDYATVASRDAVGTEYVEWMVKALASQGIDTYAESLKTVRRNWKRSSGCKSCAEEAALIPWYRGRNDIMASRANHVEEADPRASMLLNLLRAADFSYRLFAAERMNRERVLDPRLMREIAAQLDEFSSGKSAALSHDQAKAFGAYAKLLGYSGNIEYRDTLERLVASKATVAIKKHAEEALSRMKQ